LGSKNAQISNFNIFSRNKFNLVGTLGGKKVKKNSLYFQKQQEKQTKN